MADKRYTELVAAASLEAADVFSIAESPFGPGSSKKITASQIETFLIATGSFQAPLGFTPEDVANKSTDGTFAANSVVLYPSQSAVVTYVAAQIGAGAPPFLDTNPLVKGSGDATKLLRFEVDGFTTGATRVLTPPDQGGTLALLERAQTFTQAQTVALGTIVANAPGLSITETWNNAAVAFTALDVLVTNTASSGASFLLRIRTGGVERLTLSPVGALIISGTLNTGSSAIIGTGFVSIGSGVVGIGFPSNYMLQWSSTGLGTGVADLLLLRDAANVLAQRNGVNAQGYRLYNTFTSTTNFERLSIQWASSALTILTEVGSGGGTIRSLTIGTGAAVGTNIAGVDTALVGGQSTGTGLGGGIIFRTSPAGASGAGVNALVTRLEIDSTGLATFSGKVLINPPVGSNALQVTGFSLTGSSAASLIDLAGTWNTSGLPTAIKLNITDTASNTSSLLIDLQKGGISRFKLDKSGRGTIQQSLTFTPNNVDGFGGATVLKINTLQVIDEAENLVDFAVEWDNITNTPTGIKLNVTNTGSPTTLLLMDLQTSAVSQFSVDLAGNAAFGGSISLAAGKFLSISSGSNRRAGNATLVAGTVTVSNTTTTANTIVILTRKTTGGSIGTAITYTVSAGASFTINSDNPLDTSTFSYFLIENP